MLLININKPVILVLYGQKLYAKSPNVTPQSSDVLSSNISPETGYPEVGHSFLIPSRQMPEQYLKLGLSYCFPHPFKFITP